MRQWRFLWPSVVWLSLLVTSARAATNVVTTLADSGPGSLRQVIFNSVSGDTIRFTTNGTITLANGRLLIQKDLHIVGPGAASLAVSGNGATRVFQIASNLTVSISGLTIRDGKLLSDHGGGLYNSGNATLRDCVFTGNRSSDGLNGADGVVYPTPGSSDGSPGGNGWNGGGIYNLGTLTLSNCLLTANFAGSGGNGGNAGRPRITSSSNGGNAGNAGHGGAIYTSGTLVLSNCTIAGNRAGTGGIGGVAVPLTPGCNGGAGAGGYGGGIYKAGGAVRLAACTFSENRAGDDGTPRVNLCGLYPPQNASGGSGGAIAGGSTGTLFAVACTFSGNSTGHGTYDSFFNFYSGGNGGVITGGGTFSLCTFSGNGAYNNGGAFYSGDPPLLTSCTMVNNSARSGGGVFGPAIFRNCLIVDNSPDDSSSYTSQWTNIVSSTNDMRLGPLADNGGPTLTHALLPGSPALEAGDDTLAGTDQRGRPRRSGAHVDIGAYEFTTPTFTLVRMLANGALTLTMVSEIPFSVVANPDVTEESSQWTYLGPARAMGAGVYEFTDTNLTHNPYRFYRLRWP
ncbi:MAG TPA: choice-of-anchor Q domain-containing protein [Verrucomicrobiae bacterium]|jgi:hypothetical protein